MDKNFRLHHLLIVITVGAFLSLWVISSNNAKQGFQSDIERVSINLRRKRQHQNLLESGYNQTSQYVLEGQNLQMSSETRIAVLIRAHDSYALHLINLLWCLDAQDYQFDIYALIIPTEYNSIEPLKRRLLLDWRNPVEGNKKKVTAQLLELAEHRYIDQCCVLDKICSAEWRTRKLNEGWKADTLARYCTIDSPLHYYLADIALGVLLSSCSTCNGLFITNADNSYAPSFISRTATYLSPSAETNVSRKNDSLYELVLVDMLHLGKAFSVAPKRAQMDLGCVMISFKFFNATRTRFLSSLPVPAEPQDYHDADYWIMHHLLNVGARVQIVHELLFSHY